MTDHMPRKPVPIILIEDDFIDSEAITRAFRKRKLTNAIHHASDGIEGLALLRGQNGISIPRPYLVLLDLNMPRMNGIEFLREIRQDLILRDSVVFVLTTSPDDRDKLAVYAQNAAGYLIKSNLGDNFSHLVEVLDTYSQYVEFPPPGARAAHPRVKDNNG